MIIDLEECKRIVFSSSLTDAKPALKMFYASLPIKGGDMDGYTDEEYIALCYAKQARHYVELDAIQGCLIGGAIGDALGFPVEFYEDCDIFKKYGEFGITELELCNGIAHISDDTQMTLFTADGLVTAAERYKNPTADEYVQCIYESYLNWLYTQEKTFDLKDVPRSALLQVKELHSKRGPGTTCLMALRSGNCGTITDTINNSKGCGGIMRTAPIALYLRQMEGLTTQDVALIAARAAAITHGHELGFIPAAYLAAFLCGILKGDELYRANRVAEATVRKLFPESTEAEKCLALATQAVDLAISQEEGEKLDDLDAIRQLGRGAVAEETLAIALYCSFKYKEDFESGVIAAANHSGDSDSTAAVTGNILGAYLGLRRIPQKFIQPIELKDVMLDLAEKMHVHKLSTEIK